MNPIFGEYQPAVIRCKTPIAQLDPIFSLEQKLKHSYTIILPNPSIISLNYALCLYAMPLQSEIQILKSAIE